jgi:uncharacterized protein (DUF433 family)
MNTQLVESLAQVIESLAPDEYALLQEKLKSRAIQKTIGVCGGHARIRNTRIPVWTIISFQQQGADTPELLRNFPSLTTDDLSNSRFYYTTHQEEIDRAIASHQYEQEEAIRVQKIHYSTSDVSNKSL